MTVFFKCSISHPNERLHKRLVCCFAEFFSHLNFSCNVTSLKPESSYKKKYGAPFLCLP